MNGTVVSARQVSKWYGNVIGLNNFNIEVSEGITGIVGPNGAGKSTLFKLLIGTIKASAGEIAVLGERPWNNPGQFRKLGFCPDYDYLPLDLSGRDQLRFVGGMHGLRGGELDRRASELLKLVGMTSDADRKIGGYSKGMRQRIKIASSLVHDPQLLLLDEPFSGTDPVVRRELMDLVRSLNKDHGHDIILSTHVLHEVEQLTHMVALIYKGRAVATGDISEIRGLMSGHPHHIIMEGRNMTELAKLMIDQPFTVSVELGQDRKGLMVLVNHPDEFFDSIPSLLRRSGAEIERMQSTDDDLESIFRYLVG